MSIAALNELSTEIRRLGIAGASLAPGDFRLQKLIEPLEKSGAKSPVFARVAESVKSVVESNDKNVAVALLDLGTLVNAILYTQGKTGAEGDLEPIETHPVEGTTTHASYRLLAPVIEALTTTGSGRFEIVADAHRRGAFKDLRLVKPAIQALGEKYGELAELVCTKILPTYGPAIAPLLLKDLDPKGGKLHARRLRALARIDPEGTRKLSHEILDDANKEVKIAAIEGLRGSDEYVNDLISLTKARSKDVRKAAYWALAASGLPVVTNLFKEVLRSKDSTLAAPLLRDSELPEIRDEIIAAATELLDPVTATKDPDEGDLNRLLSFLEGLEGRYDDETRQFLRRCLDHRKALAAARPFQTDAINERVAALLYDFDDDKLDRELIAAAGSMESWQLVHAFRAAIRRLDPKEVYKRFVKFTKGPGQKPKVIRAVLVTRTSEQYRSNTRHDFRDLSSKPDAAIDPRWCRDAVKRVDPDTVAALAEKGDRKAEKFLVAHAENTGGNESVPFLRALIRMESAKALPSLTKNLRTLKNYWYGYYIYELIPTLPVSDLPNLESEAATLPEDVATNMVPYLAELRKKKS